MKSLSSLFYGAERIERELKRTGALREPAIPLTSQEQAEAERVDALIDAHATENEQAELALSAMAGAYVQFGFTLTELARIADSENVEEEPPLAYEPAALAAVTARIAMRQELKLPARECVRRKPKREASHCVCLREAVDAAIASGQPLTRDEVLKAARQAHNERWAWLKRTSKSRPRPPAPQPRQLSDRASKPAPGAAAPSRELVTETRTRPFRVVKRTPKWFEPPSQSIIDRQF